MDQEILKKLDSFNDNRYEYDKSLTVIDMFMASVEKYPDNKAVVFKDKVYTYRDADYYSDVLAAYLSQKGVKAGKVVAVLTPRSEAMVLVSLGILKTGAAFMALDPGYPEERLGFMCEDVDAGIIVAADELIETAKSIAAGKREIVLLSDIEKIVAEGKPVERSFEGPTADSLFTLIYTSGTTGVPKGVRLIESNLVAHIVWFEKEFELEPGWMLTAHSSFGFDASLQEIYPTLAAGAGVVVIPEEIKVDLPAIAELVRKENVRIVILTTQVGRQFALTMDCPSVKYVIVGGERLAPFEPVYPYIIANDYGPTETTISITTYNITKYEDDFPIGPAHCNTTTYIVDEDGNRVAPGEVGELWVAGPQVTGGYHNRPEENAKAFITNPFSNEDGYETVYKTGDLASYEDDGVIRFHGRRDGLVKIRGFRIELEEVEDAIRSHPDVEDAVVAAWDSPTGGKLLAAYIISDKDISKKELTSFIKERKPYYMVPSFFTKIYSIPLTQNGKVDKKALPKPELKDEEFVEPKNELEEKLCRAFEKALKLEKVSAEADFFDIGGDSLAVMRLIADSPELLLSFKVIFEGRTPVGIAEKLNKREETERPSDSGKEGYFFGPLQRQHYDWGNQIEEGFGLHCDATIHLGKNTDTERLAEAVRKVILAHPAVDARLKEMADGELRWVLPEHGLDDFKVELEHYSRAEYNEIRKSIRKKMNRPGERMFVTRIFIIKEEDGSETADFYFDFLHPIIDGDSIDIFTEDINAVYNGEEIREEEYSVFDYYNCIERELETENYQKEVKWNNDFVNSFTKKLSILKGDLDPKDENDTVDIFVKIDVDLEKMDAYCSEHSVTEGSLLAAAYGYMQAKCNGENSAVTLTIYNGRDDARYNRTMGAIYRHHPLCVRFDKDMSLADFVKQTEENILLCRAHALYHADPVPLITAFAYQGEDLPEKYEFCGDMASYEEIEDYEEENFDFFVHRREDGFYVNLTYNTLEYSKEFVDNFLRSYEKVIAAIFALKDINYLEEIV